jgi:hypothetical protein
MMELAQENKKRKNLDGLATSCFKGITTSNPFNILQQDTWKDRARTIGIVISDIVDGGTDESVPHTVIDVDSLPANLDVDFTLSDIQCSGPEGQTSGKSIYVAPESPKTPLYPEANREEFDSELLWTKVCRNRRGKHPKKRILNE